MNCFCSINKLSSLILPTSKNSQIHLCIKKKVLYANKAINPVSKSSVRNDAAADFIHCCNISLDSTCKNKSCKINFVTKKFK